MQAANTRSNRSLSTLCAIAVLGALGLSGCTLKGSGVEASEVRELESFDRIELGGVAELTVHVDPNTTQKLEIRADDNILDKIVTTVSGDELEVSVDHWMVRPKQGIKLDIWVPSLVEIDASGASDIEVFGLHGERFELDVSGASDVELEGTIDRLIIDSSGASEVDAKHLEAKTAEIELSGAGKLDVFASEKLDVDVSGAGDIRYYGDPAEISQDVSGAGKVGPG